MLNTRINLLDPIRLRGEELLQVLMAPQYKLK
jgi:hypothetical protein